MHGPRIGELGVGEAEGFVVGEALAEMLQPFVINLAAPEAGTLEPGPALEILERLAGHLGADVGEALQLLEARQMREA